MSDAHLWVSFALFPIRLDSRMELSDEYWVRHLRRLFQHPAKDRCRTRICNRCSRASRMGPSRWPSSHSQWNGPSRSDSHVPAPAFRGSDELLPRFSFWPAACRMRWRYGRCGIPTTGLRAGPRPLRRLRYLPPSYWPERFPKYSTSQRAMSHQGKFRARGRADAAAESARAKVHATDDAVAAAAQSLGTPGIGARRDGDCRRHRQLA